MIIATAVIPALFVTVALLSIVSVVNLLRQHSRTQQLVIGLQTEQEQLAQANDRLAHVAAHDSLTELLNRQGIIDHLELEIDRSRDSHKIAVLFMDVDRFKSINDSLGHGAGDQLLQVIGRRIRTVMPSGCIAGRLGGDEFVIVIDEASDISRVSDVAHRLAQVMSEPLELSGRLVRISVSIGVAIGPDANDTASELIGFANVALHRAKDAGRDRVEIFTSDIRVEMQRRAAEERSLRLAIDAGDVVPFFQPEFDASTGQIIGAEILARWVRRDGSITSAGAMLTMAEDASTLERLTSVIMQQSRPVIRRLVALGLPSGFRFRVNLPHRCTPRAWRDGQVASYFTGINPRMLTLDVYETAMFSDLVGAAGVLTEMRQLGARVCLEDAGRGGGSLSMLQSLPLDEVRVDRLHVDSLTSHANDRAVVRAMVNLAKDLGLSISADGVESGAQADALLALGCTTHQGHLYSPAITATALEDMILKMAADRATDGLMA